MHRSYKVYAGADIIEEGEHDISWEEIRETRDYYLKKTDWRAVKDRVLPNEWKDYRQALRDLPQNFPNSANDAADNWPVMPE